MGQFLLQIYECLWIRTLWIAGKSLSSGVLQTGMTSKISVWSAMDKISKVCILLPERKNDMVYIWLQAKIAVQDIWPKTSQLGWGVAQFVEITWPKGLSCNICMIRIFVGASKFLFSLNLFSQISIDVRDNPQMYSMIYCPYPGIVPGGRFTEFYYWWGKHKHTYYAHTWTPLVIVFYLCIRQGFILGAKWSHIIWDDGNSQRNDPKLPTHGGQVNLFSPIRLGYPNL